jgi:hypothetical protein
MEQAQQKLEEIQRKEFEYEEELLRKEQERERIRIEAEKREQELTSKLAKTEQEGMNYDIKETDQILPKQRDPSSPQQVTGNCLSLVGR